MACRTQLVCKDGCTKTSCACLVAACKATGGFRIFLAFSQCSSHMWSASIPPNRRANTLGKARGRASGREKWLAASRSSVNASSILRSRSHIIDGPLESVCSNLSEKPWVIWDGDTARRCNRCIASLDATQKWMPDSSTMTCGSADKLNERTSNMWGWWSYVGAFWGWGFSMSYASCQYLMTM